MANYGKKVKETVYTNGKYFVHGINEDVFLRKLVKSEWNGKTIGDLILENEKGATLQKRIFPFTPNPNFLDKKTNKAVSDDDQEDKYLANIKSIFSKAVGEDFYDKAISKVTGKDSDEQFESFLDTLARMCKDNYKNSKAIRIILIDKGGFPSVPTWNGGFTESMDIPKAQSKLTFDEAKYGRKNNSKPAGIENSVGQDDQDLPF